MHKYKGFEIVKVSIPQTYRGRYRVLSFYEIRKDNKCFNRMGEYTLREAKSSIDQYLNSIKESK